MKLSEKLRNLRIEKGETQEYVSKKLGIGITTLRNYENDNLNRLPNTYQLKQLKEHYNVTYEYLLDDNCENKTMETLKIGSELHLTDKSIQAILDVNDKSYLLNYLLENINLKSFISIFEKYYTIKDLHEHDLVILRYIYDFSDYIIDKMKNNKEDDLNEYFNKCDYSLKKLMEFIYSKSNLYFSPSDSVYDGFCDIYCDLVEIIFSSGCYKNKSIDIRIADFKEALIDFCDYFEEILFKMEQFKKLSLLDLDTYTKKFFMELFSNEICSNKNLLDKHIHSSVSEEVKNGSTRNNKK